MLQRCAAPGGRTPRRAAPPEESIARGGRGEEGGKCRPVGFPAALACGGDDAATIVVTAVAGPLLPADTANAGAADVLGCQYSPPLAVVLLLLRQLLLLLRASASALVSAVVVVVIVTAVTLQ